MMCTLFLCGWLQPVLAGDRCGKTAASRFCGAEKSMITSNTQYHAKV
jgi:hypothetical protein